jgi:hypothetical protein
MMKLENDIMVFDLKSYAVLFSQSRLPTVQLQSLRTCCAREDEMGEREELTGWWW